MWTVVVYMLIIKHFSGESCSVSWLLPLYYHSLSSHNNHLLTRTSKKRTSIEIYHYQKRDMHQLTHLIFTQLNGTSFSVRELDEIGIINEGYMPLCFSISLYSFFMIICWKETYRKWMNASSQLTVQTKLNWPEEIMFQSAQLNDVLLMRGGGGIIWTIYKTLLGCSSFFL